MGAEDDRRLWSTTARRLSDFIGKLQEIGIPSTSARVLQRTLRERGIYPARDFPDCCVAEPPDTFFTYHSVQNFVDVQEIVWQTFDFAAAQLTERRPELDSVDLEPMVSDGIRLWVDFLFIDQTARDLRQELSMLPRLLEGVRAHFVLGDVPLTRSWCAYEIALFNRDSVPGDVASLRSFVAPSHHLYHGWEYTETSDPEDKAFIAEEISRGFPGGFTGFQHVMNQANAVAVLPLTESSTWYPPAALDLLGNAVEAWYARSDGAAG